MRPEGRPSLPSLPLNLFAFGACADAWGCRKSERSMLMFATSACGVEWPLVYEALTQGR